MKVLRSWLQDYVKIKVGSSELADKLTMTGTAVDSVTQTLDEKIVIAKILEISKHPNADRLKVAKVDSGKEIFEIVCGAPNIEVGQLVPLALVGAKIGEMEIKKVDIRGVESSGMLTSEFELGLGDDHSGIKVLNKDYEIGQPLSKYIESDAVFDIEVTPNRGDELSHYGIAREIAAVTEAKLLKKEVAELPLFNNDNSGLKVIIEDEEDCLQYSALKIAGVKIEQSPEWLRQRLLGCGLRPINNVVDVTNYVMLDLGQPLHAFDARKIVDQEIIVRLAGEGEKIITLDGVERKLTASMLLIADKEKPLAIAGVMGGVNSEVTDKTEEIILESAEFDRRSIRKTAKKLSVSTEASYRFERGIDSGRVKYALQKAANMILQLAGGSIVSNIVYSGEQEKDRTIRIEYDKINSLLGLTLQKEEIDSILKSLGFDLLTDSSLPTNKSGNCLIPSWRHDVSIWQDLAEEVGRIYGFSRIPKYEVAKSSPSQKTAYHKKEYLKDVLVADGLNEVYTYPFLSQADLSIVGISPTDLLEVANPTDIENKYMRKSLLPGLLKAVAKNPSFDPVAIFEIGNVFTKDSETTYLGIAVSGKDARKIIDKAAADLTSVCSITQSILKMKELSREELIRYKIKKPVTCILEVNVETIIKSMNVLSEDLKLKVGSESAFYRPISKYPSITRDLAFIVDSEINADDIHHTIYEASDLINRVELFDEFISDKFGAGKKNVAYHLDLQHLDRTLTDKEANKIIGKVVMIIENKFKAKLRQS